MAEIMTLLDNSIYRNQVEEVAKTISLDFVRNKTILTTGASGLIGSAVVDLLIYLSEQPSANMAVIAAGRDVDKLSARFGNHSKLKFASYAAVIKGEYADLINAAILAASPASPNLFVTNPSAVIKANTEDVAAILSHLNPTAKAVYVSSSETYGNAVAPADGFIENQHGTINETDMRSCYAIGKRRGEEICRKHAKRRLAVTIVRPGHVYGPTVTSKDQRVSSAWPRDAAAGHDIIMKSDGAQLRSYVHCLDCASAILCVLFHGVAGEAYNISNRNSVITIKQMAELIASAAHVKLIQQLPTSSERKAFNPMANSSLDAKKLESLGWTATISADVGFRTTINILKNQTTYGISL